MALDVEICNPLLRTPLSLIVDDSCPVVNLTYFWIKERHAWKAKHDPGAAPDRWENAGFACEGVTSPGAFGKRREELYARATLEASLRVNGNPRPFYFLWLIHEGLPDVPVRFARPDEGVAIASIVSCAGDWFGG